MVAAAASEAAIKSPRVVGANDERASGRGVCVALLFKINIIRGGDGGVCGGGGDTRRRGGLVGRTVRAARVRVRVPHAGGRGCARVCPSLTRRVVPWTDYARSSPSARRR